MKNGTGEQREHIHPAEQVLRQRDQRQRAVPTGDRRQRASAQRERNRHADR
jgi:hypothetical protein